MSTLTRKSFINSLTTNRFLKKIHKAPLLFSWKYKTNYMLCKTGFSAMSIQLTSKSYLSQLYMHFSFSLWQSKYSQQSLSCVIGLRQKNNEQLWTSHSLGEDLQRIESRSFGNFFFSALKVPPTSFLDHTLFPFFFWLWKMPRIATMSFYTAKQEPFSTT